VPPTSTHVTLTDDKGALPGALSLCPYARA
jgi:hypothetical protein